MKTPHHFASSESDRVQVLSVAVAEGPAAHWSVPARVNRQAISAVAAALLFLGTLGTPEGVSAAGRIGFQVNSTASGDDVAPGNGVCETADHVCTLRAAIQEANANVNTDVAITFNLPTSDPQYQLSGIWHIADSLPDLSKTSRSDPTTLRITGPGADKLFIQGHASRVFNVTTSGTVSFSTLTIAVGYTSDIHEYGAGIQNLNNATVNITNCTLSGNESTAIFNVGNGTVNITNSTLRFNTANECGQICFGGAIWNRTGAINVSNSTFDQNQSSNRGGAIWNDNGIVTVTGSTFYGNGAAILGGAIGSAGGTVSITNSTFYANIAYGSFGGAGGAIANIGNGILNLTNSTLTANFSNLGGSGIYNYDINGATANIKSTIIAFNYLGSWGSGAAPDVYGAFHSYGFNLIGEKDGSTGFTLATDKKGTVAVPLNPKFDSKALRNNGGLTATIALQTGSPAVDKGSSVGLTGNLTIDQRGAGFARTVDRSVANANGGDGTDIGAFELGP